MTTRDFDDDLKSSKSKKVIDQWILFWKKEYPTYIQMRDVPVELDKLGVDVILKDEKNFKIMIDEKITHQKYPNYLIETMSVCEKGIVGWGYTSLGLTIAIVKHDDNYVFTDKPVVFKIHESFKSRIINNPNFEHIPLQTRREDRKYTSAGVRVPREWLENYNDDDWWNKKIGNEKQTKLWYY